MNMAKSTGSLSAKYESSAAPISGSQVPALASRNWWLPSFSGTQWSWPVRILRNEHSNHSNTPLERNAELQDPLILFQLNPLHLQLARRRAFS